MGLTTRFCQVSQTVATRGNQSVTRAGRESRTCYDQRLAMLGRRKSGKLAIAGTALSFNLHCRRRDVDCFRPGLRNFAASERLVDCVGCEACRENRGRCGVASQCDSGRIGRDPSCLR
jgi:hypothetical protein